MNLLKGGSIDLSADNNVTVSLNLKVEGSENFMPAP